MSMASKPQKQKRIVKRSTRNSGKHKLHDQTPKTVSSSGEFSELTSPISTTSIFAPAQAMTKYKYTVDPDLNDDISKYKVIKPLLMPLKDVASLEPEQRSKLKEEHGHLAEYIFMSQRQKCKYFHEKNFKYNKSMELPGSLPARKIEFKRNFEVRPFDKDEAPSRVNEARSYCDKYNPNIHYS